MARSERSSVRTCGRARRPRRPRPADRCRRRRGARCAGRGPADRLGLRAHARGGRRGPRPHQPGGRRHRLRSHPRAPQIVDAVTATGAFVVPRTPAGEPDFASFTFLPLSGDGKLGRTMERPVNLEGRLPHPDRADEAFLSTPAAEELGVEVGDTIPMFAFSDENAPPEPIDIRVVGVGLFSRDVLGRATARRTSSGPPCSCSGRPTSNAIPSSPSRASGSCWSRCVRAPSRGSWPTRQPAVGDEQLFLQTQPESTAKAERALRPYATALWVFAVISGLALVLVVGQALTRQLLLGAEQAPAPAAIGFTRRQQVAAVVVRAAPSVRSRPSSPARSPRRSRLRCPSDRPLTWSRSRLRPRRPRPRRRSPRDRRVGRSVGVRRRPAGAPAHHRRAPRTVARRRTGHPPGVPADPRGGDPHGARAWPRPDRGAGGDDAGGRRVGLTAARRSAQLRRQPRPLPRRAASLRVGLGRDARGEQRRPGRVHLHRSPTGRRRIGRGLRSCRPRAGPGGRGVGAGRRHRRRHRGRLGTPAVARGAQPAHRPVRWRSAPPRSAASTARSARRSR